MQQQNINKDGGQGRHSKGKAALLAKCFEDLILLIVYK
jgi:hypothetical protein